MSVPKFYKFLMPTLEHLSRSQKAENTQGLKNAMIERFKLSEEDIKEMLPSGTQAVLYNRVNWALTYLKKSGLTESPSRGAYQITDFGRKELESFRGEDITLLTSKLLRERYESFREFQSVSPKKKVNPLETVNPLEEINSSEIVSSPEIESNTPVEDIEKIHIEFHKDLKSELLSRVLKNDCWFFEKLVADLLLNLGYGGSEKETREGLKTRDEGVDGIIFEDKLGLDKIYIQAKRWQEDSIVGRPEIQKFAGALQGQKAKKGVFITTSHFSKDAKEFVKKIETKIILINGEELVQFMIESGTGVTKDFAYEFKKINEDYFEVA